MPRCGDGSSSIPIGVYSFSVGSLSIESFNVNKIVSDALNVLNALKEVLKISKFFVEKD